MNKMSFEFIDTEHQKQFQDLRMELAEEFRFTNNYLAVIYLMAGCPELNWKAHRHIDMNEGEFRSNDMFENETFTLNTETLAILAVNLFKNERNLTVMELITELDEEMFDLAINAIYLRRKGLNSPYVVLT